MNQETIDYYDNESSVYSEKRYPLKSISYSQYLFKNRREIFLKFLGNIQKQLPEKAKVLEIGCADGVIFKSIEEVYPNRFSHLVGLDISSKMIEEARKKNFNNKAEFYLLENAPQEKYNLIIELGVLPYDLNQKLRDISNKLDIGGYYIYNLAGKNSTFSLFKLKQVVWSKQFETYKDYDNKIKEFFDIKCFSVYALFIPKLWMIPFVGRLLQPIFDNFFKHILPELFHEKIYCLKKLN